MGVGQIGRASVRGVLLRSLIRDPHHVKSRSTGCLLCSDLPSACWQEPHCNSTAAPGLGFPAEEQVGGYRGVKNKPQREN